MTYNVHDDATSTTDVDVVVEMEIAGAPVREHDARRRRTWRLVAVVAAMVTVVVLWVTTGPFDGPATPGQHPSPRRPASSAPVSPTQLLDDLPQGLAPAIPYLQGGKLHLDDAVVRTTANRLMVAGGTVLVGRSNEDAARWWTLAGVDLAPLPDLDGAFTPALSPRGDFVAWTSYPDRQTTRITVMDATSWDEVDHVDLDAPFADCCGGGQEVELYGFDLHDQLYWSQRPGIHVWRPGSGMPPQRLSGAGNVLQLAPAGPLRQGGALGRVDAGGHWSRIADLPTDQWMVWSADGRLLAYGADDTGSVAFKQAPTDEWVFDPFNGTRTHLDLPAGVRAEVVAFESDDAVLVDAIVRPRLHYLLRCSTSDGACERTEPPGPPTWAFAEHSYY